MCFIIVKGMWGNGTMLFKDASMKWHCQLINMHICTQNTNMSIQHTYRINISSGH